MKTSKRVDRLEQVAEAQDTHIDFLMTAVAKQQLHTASLSAELASLREEMYLASEEGLLAQQPPFVTRAMAWLRG